MLMKDLLKNARVNKKLGTRELAALVKIDPAIIAILILTKASKIIIAITATVCEIKLNIGTIEKVIT